MIDKEFQCLSCGRVSLYIKTKRGHVLNPMCTTPGCPNHITHDFTYEKNPGQWECVDNMDQQYRDLYPIRQKLLRR